MCSSDLREVLRIFLQGVPGNLSIQELEHEIVAKTEVAAVHHTHIWSLEGEKNLLSTHIVVRDETGREELAALKKRIRELMAARGIKHVTIETDFESESCENESCNH